MTTTETPEYRQLTLDSSNDIIRHDARRSDRKYPEAALHAREAGLARLRMGEIMCAEGDVSQSAADWLSAAACFYLATDLARMQETFERVRKLDQEGKIPPERHDIHGALKEREEQIKTLEQKLLQFRQDYRRVVGPTQTVSQEVLDFLIRQIRELPGYPKLHADIYHQAQQLGKRQLAVEHLDWAQNFDPQSPELGALRVLLLIASGELNRASELSRELFLIHPEMDSLRILRAQTLVLRTEAQAADWESASEVLRPLVENGSTDPRNKLLAISLTAILRQGLGQEAEYGRLLATFDQIAVSTCSKPTETLVTGLRQTLPHVFPQPGSYRVAPSENEPHHAASLDHTALRRAFEQFAHLTAGAA